RVPAAVGAPENTARRRVREDRVEEDDPVARDATQLVERALELRVVEVVRDSDRDRPIDRAVLERDPRRVGEDRGRIRLRPEPGELPLVRVEPEVAGAGREQALEAARPGSRVEDQGAVGGGEHLRETKTEAARPGQTLHR